MDMDNLMLKIIGMSEYKGISRGGKPYSLVTLELDFDGDKAKVKCFDSSAKIGDYAKLGIGTRKTVYGCEFVVVVKEIIPAGEVE